MRISDWSSDVCSSDLGRFHLKPAFFYLSEASVKPKPPIWSFLVKFTTRSSAWRVYRSERRSCGGRLSDHHSCCKTPDCQRKRHCLAGKCQLRSFCRKSEDRKSGR